MHLERATLTYDHQRLRAVILVGVWVGKLLAVLDDRGIREVIGMDVCVEVKSEDVAIGLSPEYRIGLFVETHRSHAAGAWTQGDNQLVVSKLGQELLPKVGCRGSTNRRKSGMKEEAVRLEGVNIIEQNLLMDFQYQCRARGRLGTSTELE